MKSGTKEDTAECAASLERPIRMQWEDPRSDIKLSECVMEDSNELRLAMSAISLSFPKQLLKDRKETLKWDGPRMTDLIKSL